MNIQSISRKINFIKRYSKPFTNKILNHQYIIQVGIPIAHF